MQKKNQSFVFFGSGPVAAESLRLLAQHFSIEAVVTKPTTFQQMQLVIPDIKIHVVSNKKQLDELFTTKKFNSEVGILIDFGIIVSNKIIDYFKFGVINSHFSLLPELRGADPISFAILEGKEKTGVSLMLLVEAMDEGPILSIGEEVLTGDETTPELTDRLIKLSDSLLQNSIPKYLSGDIRPADQKFIVDEFKRKPSYTRKLKKSDGIINWTKPAEIIEREIRAYIGWPKSNTKLNGMDCVITGSSVVGASGTPGKMFIQNKKLCVYCGEGALQIDMIKPAGKKEMSSEAFLAGYKDRLGL